MLTRLVVSASIAVFVATQAPAMLAPGKETGGTVSQPAPAHARNATLVVGADGHFSGRFIVNGREITGVVDTGATFVAFGETVARDIGIRPDDLAYDHTVTTAAGDIRAARVTLDSLRLGDVSLGHVDALVVRGEGLPAALVGMSFLGRLASYSVAGDTMRLAQ